MKNFADSRLLPFINRYWHLLLGLVLLLVVLGINLEHVRWFFNTPPSVGLIWLGAGLGAVVAFSRFSDFSCLFYLLLSTLLAGFQAAGRLLPGLNELINMDFWTFSDSIRLHLHLFYLQFFSGWKANLHGYLLLCLLFFGSGAWLVWATIRLKRPLAGLIPAGFMLGYEGSLSHQGCGPLSIFMFFAILLASAASFREQHDDWEKRKISTPWELGDWPFSALGIAALVAVFTFSFPYTVTKEGRQKIADFLRPEPQQFQTINDLAAQPEINTEPLSANDFNLQNLRKPPSRSSTVVIHLRVDDPVPIEYSPELQNSASRRYYLRSAIYTTYTGSGWEVDELPPQTILETPGIGRRLLTQEIEILINHSENLFAANLPVSSGNGTFLSAATIDGSPLLNGEADVYTVQSLISDLQNNELQNSGSEYPQSIRETYLKLPEDLPEMIPLLSGEITNSATTSLEKALAIQEFLRKEYLYDLDTPPAPSGQDVVAYFLFHERRGYCSHFASAMVILLRSSGVPARLAAGYTAWLYAPDEDWYSIPASGAHAWVEVYFPNYGWVEFEPTPIHPQLLYNSEDTLKLTNESDRAAVTQKRNRFLLTAAAFLVVFAVLFFLIIRAVWNRIHLQDLKISPAGKLYQQIRRTLSRADLSAPGCVTPFEFLKITANQLESYPKMKAALQEATMVYCDTLFRADPPDEESVNKARQIWQTAFSEKWHFLLLANLSKLKGKLRGMKRIFNKKPG